MSEVEKSLRRIIDLANRIKRETIEIDPSLEYIRGMAEHIKEEAVRLRGGGVNE